MQLPKSSAFVVICATLAWTAGCGNKDSSGGAPAGTTPPSKPAPAEANTGSKSQPPAATAEPKVTPKPMPPFETLSFKQTAQTSDNGWPKFDVTNLGDKPVVFAAIYGYAYDKSGKLVKRLSTPLSWNSETA